jgi:flagellar motor switch protein FliM
MIRKVVDDALGDYEGAWNPVYPVSIRFSRSEVNPQFVGIVPTTDLVVAMSFDLEIETSAGKLIICVPYGCLEPIRNLLQSGFQSGQPEVDLAWMERFRDRVMEASVNIDAELGRAKITGKDLLNLEVGDVLVLDRYVSGELDVRVEGVLKFRGYPGVFKGNRAIKVSAVLAGRS